MYKIMLATALSSFALGVGAMSMLHAQTKPPAYLYAEIDVKDQAVYSGDFIAKAQANIEKFGGKRIAGGFDKAVALRGAAPPNRVVLLQFPDMDALKTYEPTAQALQKEMGVDKIATYRVIAIEGVEQK